LLYGHAISTSVQLVYIPITSHQHAAGCDILGTSDTIDHSVSRSINPLIYWLASVHCSMNSVVTPLYSWSISPRLHHQCATGAGVGVRRCWLAAGICRRQVKWRLQPDV